MAYDIPEVEPTEIRAGTSLIFTRDYPDYDPDDWTLTYYLVSPTAAPITVTASTYEEEFKVEVAYTTTATWPAGEYLMVGFVTSATEKHEVYRSRVEIVQDITGQESFEFRSYAEQMLDLIEEQLRTGILRESISYSINGRSFTCKSNQDLLYARNYFRSEVASEYNAGKTRKILARFVAPR